MTTPQPIDAVVERKTVWRSETMHRYAIGLIEAALRLAEAGIPYFNSDDAPDWCLPNDKTTIGAGTRLLLAGNVMAPFRETLPGLGIYGGIRKSRRPCCNGHRNQLYTLTSLPIAREFLKRHGLTQPREQMELALV